MGLQKRLFFPIKKKKLFWDFSGGAVVKNPPANAGDMGSSPGPGRSHMPVAEQLSLCTTTTEAVF